VSYRKNIIKSDAKELVNVVFLSLFLLGASPHFFPVRLVVQVVRMPITRQFFATLRSTALLFERRDAQHVNEAALVDPVVANRSIWEHGVVLAFSSYFLNQQFPTNATRCFR
jgi:hypothetical protein